MLHLGGGILAHAVPGRVTVIEQLMERCFLIILYEQARLPDGWAGLLGKPSGREGQGHAARSEILRSADVEATQPF